MLLFFLSVFDEISKVVIEAGGSLTEKKEQEKKCCRIYTHPCYAY